MAQTQQQLVPYERAGPTLLALQPANPTPAPVKADIQWTQIRGHFEARLAQLSNWRNSWIQHWSLIASYLQPRRNTWLTEGAMTQPVPNSMTRGLPINQSIVDPTGTQAMRVCSAGFMSGSMSPTRPWFKLKAAAISALEDLPQEAAEWFEDVEDIVYQKMAGSNFYDQGAQMIEDLVCYGTAPMIIYEDERDTIRCYTPVAGEYFLAASSAFRVESFYRQFVMSVAQIVEMFGLTNCPRDVQTLWQSKGASLEVERIVAHAIEPNFPVSDQAGNETRLVPKHFPWREVYWVWGFASDSPLSVRGFHDQPHVVPRWATASNDAYGRGPGMDALPDVMQLQVETLRKAEAIEKLVRPPLLADVSLKNQPSSILPGHVTYVAGLDASKGMRPIYEVTPQVKELMEDLKEIQQRVKEGFFVPLFLMMAESTKDMTAYEVAQRQQEKLQVLGPVIERFQNEFAGPAIKRIVSILARKGLLPPLPDSLQGVMRGIEDLGIEYVSMLSLAQKAAATAGIERLEAMVGRIGAVDPTVYDILDQEELLREYADLMLVKKKALRSPDQVMALRKQRQQQQAMQQAAQASMAAVQGAQTLSQTDLGGGQNALAAMLGNTSGGQQAAA